MTYYIAKPYSKQERKSIMKSKNKIFMLILLIALVTGLMATVLSVTALASGGIEIEGEMKNDVDGGIGIAESFESYKIQDTVRKDDSFVSEIQYTVYFDRGEDSSKTVIPGYNKTKIVVYAVNTGVERVGTHTNKSIIQSMLDRGYVVIVLDYLNASDAKDLALERSAQQFIMDVQSGQCFDKTTDIGKVVFAESGLYHERFLVPSGYDISVDNVFWEIDKHSMEGTLEKIVENWNSDFRVAKANKLVKWIYSDGTRKTVQNDADGNSPKWYDADGSENSESGEYTYVKFTVAQTITDCVNPDGTPLEMNLYCNVIYPTSPAAPVPVIAKASSNGDLTKTPISNDKAHFSAFIFDGYAMAVYDYLWMPMAQTSSFDYYDGSQGETKDHMNYGLMMYNDKLVNTAAMRFLRHLSANGGNTYNFALDKFGVFGASKGGWFTFIGEKIVQSPLATGDYATLEEKQEAINEILSGFMSDRYYSDQCGETRYQNQSQAIERDVYAGEYIIEAGQKQPWLTYPDGVEIISGCQAVYAGVGSQMDDVTEGHVPIFEIANLYDTYGAAYGSANSFINIAKNLDIPIYYYDTPLGHAVAWGTDLNYGVDIFDTYVSFFGYYLKNYAPKVLYTEPRTDERNVSLADKITIKFLGEISTEEIRKITVSSEEGTVSGTWSSAEGSTSWTFTPQALAGNTVYTVKIPQDLKAENGTEIGSDYSYTFVTEYDKATELQGENNYYTFTAPAVTEGNSFVFRFFAEGTNTAELYAADENGNVEGEPIGEVNVGGAGVYEIDITDYIISNAGKSVTLLLREGRGTVDECIINDVLSQEISSEISKGGRATLTSGSEAGGRTALKAAITSYIAKGVSKFYNCENLAFTYDNVTGGYTINEDDIGRTYTFSIDVYDTISRTISFKLKDMTDSTLGTLDYNRVYVNVNTKAGEWYTVKFSYTVYETKYGEISDDTVQSLNVYMAADGANETPIYFSNFTVTENLSGLSFTNVYIAEKDNGLGAYVAPISDKAFAIYNGETLVSEHKSFKEAVSFYTSGYTIVLRRDYHLTDEELSSELSSFAQVNLVLGDYTVYCDNTVNSLLHIKASDGYDCELNVEGGEILIGRTALVSYEDSSAASNGKNVKINLKNVHLGFNNNAFVSEIISSSSVADGVEMNVDISLEGCVMDFREDKHSKSYAVIFPASETEGLDINYTVSSGEIIFSATRWISICEDNWNLEFITDENGDMTKLIMPTYITWELSETLRTADGYASYASGEAQDGYVTHTLVIPENSTKYGLIPEEYSDEDTYPFVVFDGKGNFKKGFEHFIGTSSSDTTSAVNYLKNLHASNNVWDEELGMHTGTSAVILLRRNYTYVNGEKYDNWAQISGVATIDLGGHSISQYIGASTQRSIFHFTSKAWTNSGKFAYYWPTTINIINGKLLTYDMPFFSLQANQSDYSAAQQYISEKTVTFNFEGISFGLIEGASVSEMMIKCLSAQNVDRFVEAAPFNINYNNCVFDLSVKSSAESFTILDADTDSGKWIKATLKVTGGEILCDDLSGINICSSNGNYDSSIEFLKNENGEYTVLKSASNVTAIDTAVPTDDGIKFFVNNGESEGIITYNLERSSVKTVYGDLPETEADTEASKPFAVFAPDSQSDTGYTCAGVFETWKDAAAESVKVSGSIVYLRADASFSASVATSTFSGNFGNVTVDLNGFTLTRIKGYLVDVAFSNTAVQTSSIIFKNGYIVNSSECTSSNGMFCLNYKTSNTALANFDMTFDNVEFINEKTTNMLFVLWENGYNTTTTVGSKSTITFNDCTINANGATVFKLRKDSSSYNKTDIDVIVNGGNIISDVAITTANLYDKNSDDTVKFGKDKNGEYTKIILPTSVDYPSESVLFEGDEGERLSYVATSTEGTYTLGADQQTEYGWIAARYPKSDYPFAVFIPDTDSDTEYTLANVFATWKTATVEAVKTSGSVICLRTNASWSEGVASSTFSGSFGNITVDLNGFTLTRNAGYLVDTYFANTAAQTSSITFKNGKLVNSSDCTSKNGMFCLNYGNNTALATFNMTFDNVEFTNEKTTNMLFTLWENSYTTSTSVGSKSTIMFNDCTIEANGATIFKLCKDSSTHNKTDIDVVVNGGRIIFNKAITEAALVTKNTDDTLTFGKYNGNYTEFALPSSEAAPTLTLNDGTLVFTKVSDKDETATYTLSLKASTLDFTPKTSITLGSELVYNIYVPVVDYLESYTVDGQTYANAKIVTLDDGNQYYHIAVSMAASEAARNVVLKATVTIDGKDYNGTWTMSIPKYANKVIADGTDIEKTLVKDVLAYIKAAYIYFDADDKTEVVSAIDEILGDYSNAFAKVDGATDAEDGLWGIVIVLEEKPAVRFVLPEGVAADGYTFKSGNTTLKYTVGTMTIGENTHYYAEVSLFAYQMINEITYTDGTSSGTWHINSYYDFVTTDDELKNDANLISLVKKLYNYCKSAEAYRASVVVEN